MFNILLDVWTKLLQNYNNKGTDVAINLQKGAMIHGETHKYHHCADNIWKYIDNVATTAPLPHIRVGDELWVDDILFGGCSLSQMRQDFAVTKPRDRKPPENREEEIFQGCVFCPTSYFSKLLHNYICTISGQSLSVRRRPLLWYWVIIFTEQSSCNVNAGMMVGRARVKAQTQIRLALIKQKRLTWWQPNLAHEGPRRLPTPFLRHSTAGSEWTQDKR